MKSINLHTLLEKLGLSSEKNLIFLPSSNKYSSIFSSEIQTKLKIINPDAVYHFNNQPFIFFFDFTKEIDKQKEKNLHKQMWSFDYAPIIFVIHENEIHVYNAFHYQKKHDRLQDLKLDLKQIKDTFSFWELQSGKTWQWLQNNIYKKNISKKRVNQVLFNNIRAIREQLIKKSKVNLTEEFANMVILRLIFIRYLIDREVVIDEKYIAGNTINEKRKCLSQLILNEKKLNSFFDYLNERFNGTLFNPGVDLPLKQEHLEFLSGIFSVDRDQKQTSLFDEFLFDVFDFSIIPVEVIGGIYESLINPESREKDSAIYTPTFLVDYILHETIDEFIDKNEKTECKIFDPACGSGIFLVQAYRRMINYELKQNGSISNERLKEIAENNLFGIDKNLNALYVAAFSIYIALLDYKSPKDIHDFVFPDLLDKNLFYANFFDKKHHYNKIIKQQGIDFIIGNPPWGNKKNDKFHVEYINGHQLNISDFQIAQTFLFRTKDFVNSTTKCALIITSKAFYNQNAKEFKNDFLNEFYLDRFFDLSPVRMLLFETEKNPAAIIFYRYARGNKDTGKNIVKHTSVKSNIFLKHFKTLIIEKQDRKEILQQHFINYDWMFKVALYGNTYDFHFLKSMIEKPINEFINKYSSIVKGNCIKKGSPKPRPFTFLIGLPKIEAEHIQPFYTHISNAIRKMTIEDTFLESGRKIELFEGKHIFLKKRTFHESELAVSYCDKTCVFNDSIYAITTKQEIDILYYFYGIFISKLFAYYQYLTSSNWGIFRPEIYLKEYLSFPHKEIIEKEKFNELVKNFLQPIIEYRKAELKSPNLPTPKELNEIDYIINKTYGIGEIEEDLIDYCLNISRYQFQESKQDKILRRTRENELKNYAKIFYDNFSQLYNEDGEYFQIDIYPLNYFVAMNFKIVQNKPSEKECINFISSETDARKIFSILSKNLSLWPETNKIFIQKDIKGFEKNSFYIIKPNEIKCWHRAIARYDLAEINKLIENAELEQLKKEYGSE